MSLIWKNLLVLFALTLPLAGVPVPVESALTNSTATTLYRQMHLTTSGLSLQAFTLAWHGWRKLSEEGYISKNVLTICDFSQPSTSKRLYIIDLEQQKLIFQTLVAHGKNSGENNARYFSNLPNSLQSSLGFYITGSTYTGKHGLSLKLRGMEKGINDRAEERAIVIHGAAYVSENFIAREGRLGRSWGCPAIPLSLTPSIIKNIQDGSCLFIYSPDQGYAKTSTLLH